LNAFGEKVVRHRKLILVVCLLLLIPSVIGYMKVRINYDVLSYLPKNIATMKGQDILLDEFDTGGLAMCIVEGMDDKDVVKLEQKIEDVKYVKDAIWYDDLADISVPMEMLPEKYYKMFNKGDATMMVVLFNQPMSSDESMEAVTNIRHIAGKQCFLSGTTAFVTDLKDLCEQEEPIYVALAVILCCIVLAIFMDSFLLPLLFIIGIGMEIIYNLGSNIFLGEISYITKAISAVLQLGVTMDYSIFLWHSYREQKEYFQHDPETAMAKAITRTLSSVTGSSITTIAGFIALCFMSFTLGRDLGLCMAKGVVLGVIGCVTILPSLILTFDRAIEKTTHRVFSLNVRRLSKGVTRHYKAFIALFIIAFIPAIYGQMHYDVYYDLSSRLPKNLDCMKASDKLEKDFDMSTTIILMLRSDMSASEIDQLQHDVEDMKGVKSALGMGTVIGPSVPQEFVPSGLKDSFEHGKWQMMMVNTKYKVASDAVNKQIDDLNRVVDQYDEKGLVIGEAPCTKDLITISDHDFNVVTIISMLLIFLIIGLVLKSATLPFILVAVIELAICINMGIPFYTGTSLPFIASICIGTIQLGSTVDYAILMTTRYKFERSNGKPREEAIRIAHFTSVPSIIVSAIGFFAATFGVAVYSNIDIIKSICTLLARGALISMVVVIFILPSMLKLFDKIICKTSKGFLPTQGAGQASGEDSAQ
jgi:predicted RND superfamily exporter protein